MTRRRSALVIAGILSVAVAGWLGLRVAGPAWTRLQHPMPKQAHTATAPHTRQAAGWHRSPRIAQARHPGEHESVRADHPGDALAFYLRKREDSSGHLRLQNYLAARSQFAARPSLANVVPAAMPAAGGATIQSLKPTTTAQSFAWQNIGPGNVGGRTVALIVDSTSSSTLWAGGVDGGIWKSTNSGASWTLKTDLLPNIAVTTLAQDPITPTTFYAGTGEGFGNSDAERGDGIFKSTDGGATWSSLSYTANNSNFYYVNRIAVSPTTSGTIYAATNTNLYKSTDSGATWTAQTANGFNLGQTDDLVVQDDGAGKDDVYAYVANDGVYVSLDGAATYTAVLGYVASTPSGATQTAFARGSIAIAPSSTSPSNTIYVVTANDSGASTNPGDISGLYKTTDNFTTTVTEVLNQNTTTSAAARLNATMFGYPIDDYSPTGNGKNCAGTATKATAAQGWYDQAIAVDPSDATGNTVWVGGTDVFRSTDGGQTFQLASDEEDAKPNNSAATAWDIHSDQHAIVFSKTGSTIFFANDGGVFETTNPSGGVADVTNICNFKSGSNTSVTSPVAYLSLDNGYSVTQFYDGSVPTTGNGYIAGAQDNGTSLYNGNANDWSAIFGGDGGDTAIDPTDASRMYMSYVYIAIARSDDGGTTNTATSAAYNYSYISAGIDTSSAGGGSGLFINPYVLDTNSGHTTRMYVTNQNLWMTEDATVTTPTWNYLQLNDGTDNGSALAVAPGNSNVVYVGMENGAFYRLLNP